MNKNKIFVKKIFKYYSTVNILTTKKTFMVKDLTNFKIYEITNIILS